MKSLRWTSYCPHRPTPIQLDFLTEPAFEAFYGGAAGGGKSDALLMAALQYVDEPGYAALILRRSYADLALPGAIMDRAIEWLGPTDAKWNEIDKTFTFPSGAKLVFGYLATHRDKYRYQSSEFQFVAFDELTQFEEPQYRYLLSRVRRLEGSNVPLRVRSASNPGGVGHDWVHRYFVDPGDPSRPFIPARLEDNPFLDTDEYDKALSRLDPITRAQLRYGDWSVRPEGGMFKRGWFRIVEHPPMSARRIRYWDMAATVADTGTDPDWTAGAKVSRDPSGMFTIEHVTRLRDTPANVEQHIRTTADLDGVGTSIRMEQEPGASGKTVIDHYLRNVLAGFDFRGDRPSGPKIARAAPVSALAEQGLLQVVRGPWVDAFMDEAELFPQGAHDDQVDAVAGAVAGLSINYLDGPLGV